MVIGMVRDATGRLEREQQIRGHIKRLTVMRDLERRLIEHQESPRRVAEVAVELLSHALQCSRVSVVMQENGGGSAVILALAGPSASRLGPGVRLHPEDCGANPGLIRGKCHVVEDLRAVGAASAVEKTLLAEGIRSYLNLPLQVRRGTLGSLNVAYDRAGPIPPGDLDLLTEAGTVLALALDNARLLQETVDQGNHLQQVSAHLDRVETGERKRLAQELHDRVGQNLTALGINLNILRASLSPGLDTTLVRRIDDSLAIVGETGKHIRDVMSELRPAVLDDYGLRAALRWLAGQFEQRTRIPAHVDGGEFVPRLGSSREGVLFRIVQEALTNVAKHAGAAEVWIEMSQDEQGMRVLVRDDGAGFDPDTTDAGPGAARWGLDIMRERMRSVGGRLEVRTRPGAGCTIEAALPAGED